MQEKELTQCLQTLAFGNVVAKRFAKEILGNRRLDVLHYVMGSPVKALKLNKVDVEEFEALTRRVASLERHMHAN